MTILWIGDRPATEAQKTAVAEYLNAREIETAHYANERWSIEYMRSVGGPPEGVDAVATDRALTTEEVDYLSIATVGAPVLLVGGDLSVSRLS